MLQNKYIVPILSGIAAVLVAIQQYLTSTPDIKVIIYVAAATVVSVLAKDLPNKAATILGIVGTQMTSVLPDIIAHAQISWAQLVGQTVMLIAAVFAPNDTPTQTTTVTTEKTTQ